MELIKQPVIKESPTFPTFSILSDCCMRVFLSFVIKAFAKFKKLIRFHRHQAYIICKIGLILKILTEIICQKLLVSNAILAILDYSLLHIIHVFKKTDNVPSQLLPISHGISWTWGHDVPHIAGANEPKIA